MSAAPTTPSHHMTPLAPVKASDPELAVTGSDALGLEDPAFAFVTAPIVVEVAAVAAAAEAWLVGVDAWPVVVGTSAVGVGPELVVGSAPAEAGLELLVSVPVPGATIVVGVDESGAGHPGGFPVLPVAW
jgi:hypothetical protein